MKKLNLFLAKFVADESGQDLIEYAMVASFIALLAVSAMTPLAAGIRGLYTQLVNDLTVTVPAAT